MQTHFSMSGDIARPPQIAPKLSEFSTLKDVEINCTFSLATCSFQSLWTLPYMTFRPSWTNVSNSFFKFKTVCCQPSKYDGEAAKLEISPFLSYPLTFRNQTWYIDSCQHPGDTKIMVTFDLWGALCLKCFLLTWGNQTIFNVWLSCQTSPYSF